MGESAKVAPGAKGPNPGVSARIANAFRDEPRIAPHMRDPLRYDRIGSFYGPNRHYYGYRIHALPPYYAPMTYWGRRYYFWDGCYYGYYRGSYYVCRPPYGIFFDRTLYALDLAVCSFAYYNTVYRQYQIIDENYELIQQQNRIIAENNARILAGQTYEYNTRKENFSQNLATQLGLVQNFADMNLKYYYDDGIFFTLDANGQYVTIVPPAGALISELPEDCEEIILDGQRYFRVDDTVYRLTISDGKALFEVLGQMPSKMYNKYLN